MFSDFSATKKLSQDDLVVGTNLRQKQSQNFFKLDSLFHSWCQNNVHSWIPLAFRLVNVAHEHVIRLHKANVAQLEWSNMALKLNQSEITFTAIIDNFWLFEQKSSSDK